MYGSLGIHWASSLPAFLTVACMPFPFVMYRYGGALRMKCKYAFEAAGMMRRMQMQQVPAPAKEEEDSLLSEGRQDLGSTGVSDGY